MYSNNYESCVYVFGVFVDGLSFPKPGRIVVVVSKKSKTQNAKRNRATEQALNAPPGMSRAHRRRGDGAPVLTEERDVREQRANE